MSEKSISSTDTVLSALEIAYKPEFENRNDIEDEHKDESGSTIDLYFAASLLILSFLIVRFVDIANIGWLHTILMICNISISFLYVKYRGFKIKAKDMIFLLFIFVACLPNVLYTNNTLKICNIIFIHILQMYWLLKCCGHLSEGKESDWIIYDGLASVFLVPLTCLEKSLSFLARFSLKRISLKKVMMVFTGCVISIPILFIVLSQLFVADDTFYTIFSNAFENMDQVVQYLVTFIISIPLFLYYYSVNYGNIACGPDTMKHKKKLENFLQKMAKVPSTILITVEVLLCIVYLIFIGSTIYSIYAHVALSTGFAYAEYARDGFFELCRITVLNLFVLSFIEIVIEKVSGKIHVFVKRILCIETICIILSALYRMYLYINAYGLTYKRIYATWLMIVLFGAFLMILFDTFKKGKVILCIARYAVICFFILNFINVDGMVQSSTSTAIQHKEIYNTISIYDLE